MCSITGIALPRAETEALRSRSASEAESERKDSPDSLWAPELTLPV